MDLEELFSEVEKFGFDPITYQYFHQLFDKRTIILNDYVVMKQLKKVFYRCVNLNKISSTEPVTLDFEFCGRQRYEWFLPRSIYFYVFQTFKYYCPRYGRKYGRNYSCWRREK